MTPPRVPLIPKLRGQFAEFLDNSSLERLRIFTSPTCVSFGTDGFSLPRGFSRRSVQPLRARGAPHHHQDCACGFSYTPPDGLDANLIMRWLFLPLPPIGNNDLCRYRNINLLSIDYAFRPRLRFRLTLGGFTVPRKPWVCGEQDSHLLCRYLFRDNHF